MVTIQKITVSDVASETPLVEIVIADNENIEEAETYLTASIRVQRQGISFENVQLSALDRLREVIDEAVAPVRQILQKQP